MSSYVQDQQNTSHSINFTLDSDEPRPSAAGSSNSASKQPIPQNLRFQRRTSEKAFLEGSYRDGSMDYSTSAGYAGGASPWANSPEQGRASLDNSQSASQDTGSSSPAPANGSFERQPSSQQSESWRSDSQPSTQWSSQQQTPQYQQPQQQPQQEQENTRNGEAHQPHTPARYHGAQNNNTTPPAPRQQQQQHPQYKLQLKITGLERTAKKDPILRFDAYTNLPKFRTTQFRDIRRTHSEFQKLFSHLQASNPEALVPAVPPASTSAGVGTDEDETRTKAALQRWLNTVCSNEVLMRDEEMVFFVESDFGYSPVVRKRQPATGMRRKVLKQFAPPPDDTPELLESRPIVKAYYLGTMDAQQKVDRVVKHRRALGLAESDLGSKLAALTAQENHPGLGNAYRKLGRLIQNTGDFHAAQGTAEATTISDPLAYASSDAFVVKETLTNRHMLLRELIQAQQTTRSKLIAADRLKASSSVKRDKVDEAITALDEARSQESYLQRKTQRVTSNLLHEKRKWFTRSAADLRTAIREYVVREIEAERRTLATLEQVRPDIRAIDASGGLSRLGREEHPVIRRSALASSQGPKGDAWSGVQRRPDGLNRSISGSVAGVPEVSEEDDEGGSTEAADGKARKRALSGTSSLAKAQEDEDDRIDARNAASRLAQTTF